MSMKLRNIALAAAFVLAALCVKSDEAYAGHGSRWSGYYPSGNYCPPNRSQYYGSYSYAGYGAYSYPGRRHIRGYNRRHIRGYNRGYNRRVYRRQHRRHYRRR